MRVLVLTGGLFTLEEPSLLAALLKQARAARAAEAAWMDVYLKVAAAQRVMAQRALLSASGFDSRPYAPAVRRMLAPDPAAKMPELTEVLLATLLRDAGCAVEVCTWSQLYADAKLRHSLLQKCDSVFASTTLLRDRSELEALLPLLREGGARVVVGGALVGILRESWPPTAGVDLLAVGYGELLVPAIARWLREGGEPRPPEGGRLERRGEMWVMHAPLPEGKSLDALPSADWTLAAALHGRPMPVVSYESVRGCPYRCAFCNYPFLFADSRFRLRSAEQIAADWERLAAGGAHTIICLDSLFTVPKRRLDALCERLIAAGSPVRWVCYARADDLREAATVARMREAGCVQVQVGVESGDQGQLDRMDKRCTVESNQRAMQVCRDEGVTSLATFILGYPGETESSIQNTFSFMRQSPPDFYYAAPFSTKYTELPVLSAASRERFGLRTVAGGRSAFPPWRHDTMDAVSLVGRIRAFNEAVVEERLALDGGLFYSGTLNYRAGDRADLLAFQRDVGRARPAADLALRPLLALARRQAALESDRLLGVA